MLNFFLKVFRKNKRANDNLPLKPHSRIQKILISTSSRLTGEYFKDNRLYIANAFPSIIDRVGFESSTTENPYCRNYYIVTFYFHDAGFNAGTVILLNDLTKIGEYFCICLSILYGKRFDYHGVIENKGIFGVPYLQNIQPITNYNYTYNNHRKRVDLDIELNLKNVSKIERLFLDDTLNVKFENFFETAGRFYLNALQIFDTEPELSYLNLITSLEILSNYYEYTETELLDENLIKLFDEIKNNLDNGEQKLKDIKKTLFQVRKKYWLLVNKLINNNFFSVTESNIDLFSFKKVNFEKNIKSAYDLRSKFVHTGASFGNSIKTNVSIMNELPLGNTMLNPRNRDFEKILDKSPCFTGLERVVRYCLLSFIHKEAFPFDNRLD